MKYIRVTGTPDPERTPELFDLLARSSFVKEARLYDWNLSQREGATALLEVDGDIDQFQNKVVNTRGIQSAHTTRVIDGRFTLLYVLKPTTVPLLKGMLGALTQEGIVVAKPIVYRGGQAHARLVGSASTLQEVVDNLPTEINLEINSIGDFNHSRKTPVSELSDRQREALLEAFDLGYYEHPRKATHADVAARLDCAPHTASEHLQKAEIKVLTEVLQPKLER